MKKVLKNILSVILLCGFIMEVQALDDPSFDTENSTLSINQLYVDGVKSFNNVKIKFNFANSTFQVLGAAPADNSIPVNPIDTVTVNNFTIGLRGCVSVNKTVTCHLLVTSNEFDGTFSFCAKSGCISGGEETMVVDNLNNSYTGSKVTLANESNNSRVSNVLLVADIPTEATIEFSNISTKAKNLSLVILGFIVIGNNDTTFNKIEFRNVAF